LIRARMGLLCVALIGLSLFAGAASPARAQKAADTFTLSDLGYKDTLVQGVAPQFDVFVPGPGAAATQPATLRLAFSHSALLDPGHAAVRVEWNSLPVYSEFLGADSADRVERAIRIPASAIQPAGNQLRISFLLLLPNDTCADDTNPARYATIYQESALAYGAPVAAATSFDLGLFPAAFVGGRPATEREIAVVLPHDPTPAELSAAATAVGQLSRSAAGTRFRFTALDATQMSPPADQPAIAVGSPARNPLVAALAPQLGFRLTDPAMTLPDGRQTTPDTGLVLLGGTPVAPARPVLALTGGTDTAIASAARLIGNQRMLRALQGAWAEAQEVRAPDAAPDGSANRLTLFANGLVLEGARQADATERVVLPPLRDADMVRVSLKVARSDGLDRNRSFLRLVVNDRTAASVPLGDVSPDGTDIHLDITARFFRPGINTIVLSGLSRPTAGACATTNLNQTAESFLRVAPGAVVQLPPAAASETVSLQAWPYPLVGPGDTMPTLVAGEDGVSALLQTAGALATLMRGDSVAFNAMTAGPADPLPAMGARVVFGSMDRLPYRDALLPNLPLEAHGTTWTVRDAGLPIAKLSTPTAPGVIEITGGPGGTTTILTATDPALLALGTRALAAPLPDTTAMTVYRDDQAGNGLRVQALTAPNAARGGVTGGSPAPRITTLRLATYGFAALAAALCATLLIASFRRGTR
jgi:hypothetical protein